jgi:opacity protein-like surface antigen
MRFAIVLFLTLPVLAPAQSFEGSISGGVSQISNSNIGGGYSLGNGFRLAFRTTVNTGDRLGYEFGYAYNRTQLEAAGSASQGMAIHHGSAAPLLYATPQGSRIRPFVTVGVHFANFVPPGQTAQYGQGNTKFGINYGGGVKVKVSGPWQIRFDVRQFNTGKPFGLGASGRLLQTEISAGIGFTM